eukprot:scaffold662_cov124-Skeletonema_dohrnii-CCMP3373.AAC.4
MAAAKEEDTEDAPDGSKKPCIAHTHRCKECSNCSQGLLLKNNQLNDLIKYWTGSPSTSLQQHEMISLASATSNINSNVGFKGAGLNMVLNGTHDDVIASIFSQISMANVLSDS